MSRSGSEAATVRLRVQPGASRNEVVGWQEGTLRLRVTAPPVEGKANRAVAALLGRALAVAPSRVTVVRGDRGRDKVVRIEGLTSEEVQVRLGRGTS